VQGVFICFTCIRLPSSTATFFTKAVWSNAICFGKFDVLASSGVQQWMLQATLHAASTHISTAKTRVLQNAEGYQPSCATMLGKAAFNWSGN
jgi:hypothetical protein